jgi:hypothetical protein
MSKIKKDYKFEEFLNSLETDIKTLKDEILELFNEETKEEEDIEIRLRNENNIVFILKIIKKEGDLLAINVDRVKHISASVKGLEGDFYLDKNFIKPLKHCEIDGNILVVTEQDNEDGW